MKRLVPFFLLLCGGCATSWPIYKVDLSRDQIRCDKENTIPVRVAVKAAPEAEFRHGWSVPPEEEWVKSDRRNAVSNLVADLRKTGLFKSVVTWAPESQYDVLIEARRASGTIRCGTPFVMRAFTLGLVSGESSYRRMYEFRCLATHGSARVDLTRDYRGSYYAPSILFLPFLAWQGRTEEADLLRHDLVPLLPQIEALREEKEPGQRRP